MNNYSNGYTDSNQMAHTNQYQNYYVTNAQNTDCYGNNYSSQSTYYYDTTQLEHILKEIGKDILKKKLTNITNSFLDTSLNYISKF